MYLLRLLGGAVLEGPDGPVTGRAAQRRQIGVLAALALARGRPVSRDRLIGLFWSEVDTDRARRMLSDAVYLLRRELGEDAIAGAGDDLRLQTSLVRTDLAEFEAALESADFAGARRWYGGPLLDGLYWDGAAEWERQVSAERQSVTRAYARALENVAEARSAAGDPSGAADTWRHRAALDPLDTRVCLRLMEALAAAGDRAGALQQARVHAALLREEVGLQPDPAVEALAERLMNQAAVSASNGEQAATPAVPPLTDPPGIADAARPGHLHADVDADRQPRRFALPRKRPVALALVTLMVMAAMWIVLRPAAPAASPDRLMVLPFSTLGGERVAYLGEGIVDLLSVTLNGAGSIRTVDPRAVVYHARQSGNMDPRTAHALAMRLDAGLYVHGTISEAGARLRIAATLYSLTEAPIGTATVEGTADELFTLIDRLAAELLALHARTPQTRLEHLAARTTTSMPALREYLAAEALFRRRAAQWEPEVVEAFGRAAALDSTFALAHYRLSVAASWVGDPSLSRSAAEQARRHAARLGRRERDLLDAWHARLRGDADRAEQMYRSLLDRYPDDVEASWQLAELIMRAAPFRGDSVIAAERAYRRVLDLDPTHGCARCSLIFIALQRRDITAAEAIAAGLPDGGAAAAPGLRLLRALERSDTAAAAAVMRELGQAPVWTAHEAHFRARLWGLNPSVAAAVGRLADDARFPAEWRGLTRTLLVDDELAAGRPAAARTVLRQTAELEPGWALVLEVLTALGPVAPLPPEARSSLLARVEAWGADTTRPSRGYFTAAHNGIYPELRLYLLGILQAAAGNTAAAEGAARQLETVNSDLSRFLAAGVSAWSSTDAEALRLLDQRARMLPAQHVWMSPVLAGPLDRLRHADLLTAAGRTDDALQLLAAFGQNPWDMSYIAPASLRSAQVLEQLGRNAEAALHYSRVAEIWRDAEPPLSAKAAAAAERAAKLQPHR